jgi:hypothetical protein
MSVGPQEYEPKTYRAEWQSAGTAWMRRAFVAGIGATLSSAGLERGDALPGETGYVIVDNKLDTDKKTGTRIYVVTANKYLGED